MILKNKYFGDEKIDNIIDELMLNGLITEITIAEDFNIPMPNHRLKQLYCCMGSVTYDFEHTEQLPKNLIDLLKEKMFVFKQTQLNSYPSRRYYTTIGINISKYIEI